MSILNLSKNTNTYIVNKVTPSAKGCTELNETTQNYLSVLKQRYSDVNITVVDFKNGKQEDAYMLGSRGYNNIAVSSGIIDKMEKDPVTAARYEKIFAEMSSNTERIEKFAEENNDEILSAGVLIDKDGKVSYWMVGRSRETMENPGTVYKEKVQKQIAEKRVKKKEEENLKEKRLEKAKTMEKLLEKMKAESNISVKVQEKGKGTQLDLTI